MAEAGQRLGAPRFKTGLREALYHAMKLTQIEIIGDTALLHRKFDGWLTRTNGHRVNLQWQTLYLCRKHEGRWKIASFTGYLPNVIFERSARDDAPQKAPPAGIWQHVNSLSDVSALKTLLVEIEQSRQSGMGTDEQQWLDRACALLGEQPAKQAGYANLARQLGVSHEVFRRRFRRLTGMSPHRYRQRALSNTPAGCYAPPGTRSPRSRLNWAFATNSISRTRSRKSSARAQRTSGNVSWSRRLRTQVSSSPIPCGALVLRTEPAEAKQIFYRTFTRV